MKRRKKPIMMKCNSCKGLSQVKDIIPITKDIVIDGVNLTVNFFECPKCMDKFLFFIKDEKLTELQTQYYLKTKSTDVTDEVHRLKAELITYQQELKNKYAEKVTELL